MVDYRAIQDEQFRFTFSRLHKTIPEESGLSEASLSPILDLSRDESDHASQASYQPSEPNSSDSFCSVSPLRSSTPKLPPRDVESATMAAKMVEGDVNYALDNPRTFEELMTIPHAQLRVFDLQHLRSIVDSYIGVRKNSISRNPPEKCGNPLSDPSGIRPHSLGWLVALCPRNDMLESEGHERKWQTLFDQRLVAICTVVKHPAQQCYKSLEQAVFALKKKWASIEGNAPLLKVKESGGFPVAFVYFDEHNVFELARLGAPKGSASQLGESALLAVHYMENALTSSQKLTVVRLGVNEWQSGTVPEQGDCGHFAVSLIYDWVKTRVQQKNHEPPVVFHQNRWVLSVYCNHSLRLPPIPPDSQGYETEAYGKGQWMLLPFSGSTSDSHNQDNAARFCKDLHAEREKKEWVDPNNAAQDLWSRKFYLHAKDRSDRSVTPEELKREIMFNAHPTIAVLPTDTLTPASLDQALRASPEGLKADEADVVEVVETGPIPSGSHMHISERQGPLQPSDILDDGRGDGDGLAAQQHPLGVGDDLQIVVMDAEMETPEEQGKKIESILAGAEVLSEVIDRANKAQEAMDQQLETNWNCRVNTVRKNAISNNSKYETSTTTRRDKENELHSGHAEAMKELQGMSGFLTPCLHSLDTALTQVHDMILDFQTSRAIQTSSGTKHFSAADVLKRNAHLLPEMSTFKGIVGFQPPTEDPQAMDPLTETI